MGSSRSTRRLLEAADPQVLAVQWSIPDLREERGEITRQARELGLGWGQLLRAFGEARLVPLDAELWARLQNTESTDPNLTLQEILSWTHRDVGRIVEVFRMGGTLPAPMVLAYRGTPICVAGNTRLCVSKVLGVQPQVFLAEV